MVTSIYLRRLGLISKYEMESYCKGEDTLRKVSVNDDLESLFEKILLGKKLDEWVQTYFVPKLTEEELEFVDRRDTSYLRTFESSHPDLNEIGMPFLKESDSKYVQGWSDRRTFVIKNSSKNSLKNNCSLQ